MSAESEFRGRAAVGEDDVILLLECHDDELPVPDTGRTTADWMKEAILDSFGGDWLRAQMEEPAGTAFQCSFNGVAESWVDHEGDHDFDVSLAVIKKGPLNEEQLSWLQKQIFGG